MKCALHAATLLATLGFATDARAQTSQNLGFELRDSVGKPSGWYAGGAGFEIALDSVQPFAGRFSLRTRWVDTATHTPQRFAVATQRLPVAAAAGRRLRLTGYLRTQDVANGYAGFWMRVDGPLGILAFDNMGTRGVRGTTPWTQYVVELPVDSGATQVLGGPIHPGTGTAWFDSVSVEVFGPAMPRAVASLPSFTPVARPPEDMTRLLTDAELAVPADSAPIAEDVTWSNWVRANAHPVRSLGASDFSDLRFLAPLLNGKRLVQLGESAHGVAEFNMVKVRLIKYLHEEMGYDVIAFESSLFECDRAQRNVVDSSAVARMRGCIFGVWHADEVLPLFEYIKQTQTTTRPLALAGFDVQTSSVAAKFRPVFFRDLVATIDSSYARRVHFGDSVFRSYTASPDARDHARRHREPVVAFYDSLATFFRTHRSAIERARPDDPHAALLARQTAVSMATFVRQLAAGYGTEGTEIRDRGMADNLDFLLNELYPGKKVITWAHNFHIQHRANAAPAADTGSRPSRTMGVWVAERHRPELYTIGLFMYRGSAATNTRQTYPIARMSSGSLESILHRAPWRYTFVDFSQPMRALGTEWMWRRIPAMTAGTQPDRIVPRDEYDGILFIDETHPPRYLLQGTQRLPP